MPYAELGSGFKEIMRRIWAPSSNILFLAAAAVFLALAFLFSFNAQAQRLAAATHPALTIWAWERDEDLSFIDTAKVSVAYFAGTVYVHGDIVRFRPRTQKLTMPKGTHSFPVFRIESIRASSDSSHKTGFSSSDHRIPTKRAAGYVAKTIASQVEKLWRSEAYTDLFNGIGSNCGSKIVQIDFDALEDERVFYKELLRNLKCELSSDTKISITSLASWLLADKWLERGSADEAVAMLFSMGAGKREALSRLKRQSLDSGAGMPIAVGISASESATNRELLNSRIQRKIGSLYIFSSKPWNEQRLRTITSEALAQ